ncbi:hypothetical protein SAMN05216480_1068 [Pustulibacterium marinum]|uniref:DUF998 domain-containing protein n=1 Tax=Pustulibacterium marinum TaxID=1224947 RepID=A0A1I7GV57_9FLAO|nr:hypothetical protein [Pustulibacterium marinum]SFU52334.1 hypothetical protein SAMN05216480_1068 [Pustulibacterium marinum]
MKPIWNTINKVIGFVNLIIGMIIFYMLFDLTKHHFNTIQSLSEHNGFHKIETSFFDLILEKWKILFNATLFTVSGMLLLSKKKLGWILSYSCWIVSAIILLPITIYGMRGVTTTLHEYEYWDQVYGGIGLLFSLTVLILLSLQPIRILHNIDRNSWLLSFGIVLLIFLMKSII